MVLKNYLSCFINKIYLDKYIRKSVTEGLDDIMNKFENYETVTVLGENCNSSVNNSKGGAFEKYQQNSSKNHKTVMLVVNQVLQLSESLLENIIFLDLDWNHSNKIFEHFTDLLKIFETKINSALAKLTSVDIEVPGSSTPEKSSQKVISSALVQNEDNFKAFYKSFSLLRNKSTSIGNFF